MQRNLSELEGDFEFLEPAVPPPKRLRPPAPAAAVAAAARVLPPQPSPRGEEGGGGGGGAEITATSMPCGQKKHQKGERTCPRCLQPMQRQKVWLNGHAWRKPCPHKKAPNSAIKVYKAKMRKQQREQHK